VPVFSTITQYARVHILLESRYPSRRTSLECLLMSEFVALPPIGSAAYNDSMLAGFYY
jgi:hypothetical protein